MNRQAINSHLSEYKYAQPEASAMTRLRNALIGFKRAVACNDMIEAARLAGLIRALRKEVGE